MELGELSEPPDIQERRGYGELIRDPGDRILQVEYY